MTQSLAERLSQARREMGVRERRDVSQLDVAKAIGVSGASISQWESGERVPREDALAKLAAFLGVTPAYLRYGVQETAPARQVTVNRIPLPPARIVKVPTDKKAAPEKGGHGRKRTGS